MLCTEIVSEIRNNFCTTCSLLVLQKGELLTKIYLYLKTRKKESSEIYWPLHSSEKCFTVLKKTSPNCGAHFEECTFVPISYLFNVLKFRLQIPRFAKISDNSKYRSLTRRKTFTLILYFFFTSMKSTMQCNVLISIFLLSLEVQKSSR